MADEAELTQRARLAALRDRLADQITSADERALPALSREYRAVLADLEALPSESSTATVDQLKERRAERRRRGAAAAN
jgi:hypothetical protein